MFDGNLRVTVGIVHEMSPISSEPPLLGFSEGFPSPESIVDKPFSFFEFTSF